MWCLKHVIFYRGSPPDSCKSLSLFIPMPSTHLRNAEYGRDFVNKSARLSHDLVCKMGNKSAILSHDLVYEMRFDFQFSPFFWSSWGRTTWK